ncbi:hypothetical protein N7517_009487 [Penicillium concentricum]|uniref:Uncharacterized protein n=1 Tax=Penicillium concentricum TaxID=293559 RepID=A0A9W9UZ79_9EURO|nr:uncharacterized protein N7517_009487 [Penicillium concentricum]KAJ5360296.1 hypothetical protein N7517_009487 [Penicillium concentricum]
MIHHPEGCANKKIEHNSEQVPRQNAMGVDNDNHPSPSRTLVAVTVQVKRQSSDLPARCVVVVADSRGGPFVPPLEPLSLYFCS